MRTLVKKFLDQDLSRRDFGKAMVAMGFSSAAIDSVLSSVAYAAPIPPIEGVEFTGSGGEILAECMMAAEIEYVFDVNSTSQASFYDALSTRPELKMITGLQEGQTTAMAQGYELASGKTAALFIPSIGTPNALSNLYNAWKDRSAIAVFSDGSSNLTEGRDGFQQVDDWLEPTEQFTKWRWQLKNPDRIGEMVRRVIKLAGTVPGGPVYLRIPANILNARDITQTIYPQSAFNVPVQMEPKSDLIEAAAKLLVEAKNPLISVAAEVTRAGATDDLIELAELLSISVAQGYSVYGDFPTNHPLYKGNYSMGFPRGLRQTDVFINLGGMMPDPTIFTAPVPKEAKVIHARTDYNNIGNMYPTDIAIAAGMKETIRALIDNVKAMLTEERIEKIRSERWAIAEKDYADALEKKIARAKPNWDTNPIHAERLSYELGQGLEEDAIVIAETGDRAPKDWIDYSKGGRTMIGQTTGYALGWGVGAAIGAKIAQPNRQVISLVGDGAFLFGQIESFWTASRYDVPITIVVYNNRAYDGERNRIVFSSHLARTNRDMWKDMSCYLGDPVVDYVGLANSFSIDGEKISSPNEVRDAFKRAAAVNRDGRPYVIDAYMSQKGQGAGSEWHPEISIAETRTKKI